LITFSHYHRITEIFTHLSITDTGRHEKETGMHALDPILITTRPYLQLTTRGFSRSLLLLGLLFFRHLLLADPANGLETLREDGV
jgi:hypothetical protein